jgi:hypothetical protein
MVSLCGDHWTWKISSLCDSNECSFSFRLRKSHRATVLSKNRNVLDVMLALLFASKNLFALFF